MVLIGHTNQQLDFYTHIIPFLQIFHLKHYIMGEIEKDYPNGLEKDKK